MTDLTPTSILALLNTTKEQRSTFVAQVIQRMLDGYAEPIDVHLQVKCMEEICKAIKEDEQYKTMVLESAHRHKGHEFSNAKVEVRSLPKKYDYSVCNDPELKALETAVEIATADLKAQQKFLQSIPTDGIEYLTKDGEVVRLMPPTVKDGADTVFITLK